MSEEKKIETMTEKQLEALNKKLAEEIQTEVNSDNLALGGENIAYANEND